MRKNIIIVEGPQGVGKGEVSNLLREKIPYSTLMRLSGIQDKTKETGLEKVYSLRSNELEFIKKCSDLDTTFILDRSFLTEKVYCNLGYKDYSFEDQYELLCQDLNSLTDEYNVYLIGLFLSDTTILEERLKRDKAEVEYSKFNIVNSINQQDEYIKEINKISDKFKNINCLFIDTDANPCDIFEEIKNKCNLVGEM